jgi:hypothetical protein
MQVDLRIKTAADLTEGDIIILDGVEVTVTKVTRYAKPFPTLDIEWVSTVITERPDIDLLEECEDLDCTGCPWCDAHGITAPGAAGTYTVEPTDEFVVPEVSPYGGTL